MTAMVWVGLLADQISGALESRIFKLILEDRRSDFLRGLPADAIQEKILVG